MSNEPCEEKVLYRWKPTEENHISGLACDEYRIIFSDSNALGIKVNAKAGCKWYPLEGHLMELVYHLYIELQKADKALADIARAQMDSEE